MTDTKPEPTRMLTFSYSCGRCGSSIRIREHPKVVHRGGWIVERFKEGHTGCTEEKR